MSDFIVSSDVSSGVVQSGHNSRRSLKGEIETVRPKLIAAIERLGYHVISEQPLQAKRNPSGTVNGKIYNSKSTLSIGLRPTSPNSTVATFDYEIVNSSMYKGDHTTIEREVDAIAALVNRSTAAGFCQSCGATQTNDVAYCRSCGALNAQSEPAELEVLRIDSETRFGHRANITGISLTLSTMLLGFALIFLGTGKAVSVGWAIFLMGQAARFISLFLGSHVIHRALNRSAKAAQMPPAIVPEPRQALPESMPPSVTDGTTELLPNAAKTLEFEPVKTTQDT